MGITVATIRTTCNVGVGNQDLTTADLGGLTAGAAFFIATRAVSDGVAADHAIIGLGAASSASDQWALGCQREHGSAVTDSDRLGMTDECCLILNAGAATVDGEANSVGPITNGWRINWGNAPAAAYYLTAVLIAGTDLSALADTFTLDAVQNNTVDVNTVGFEPDLLLLAHLSRALNDVGSTTAVLGFGAAINKTNDPQASYVVRDRLDGSANGSPSGRVTGTYGVLMCDFDGSAQYAGEIGAWDGSGFSCTSRLGAPGANRDVGLLALSFGGAVDYWLDVIQPPVAAGSQDQVGPGFTPQFVMCGLTQMTALDTSYDSNAEAGSWGVSNFDEDDEYCDTNSDEAGSATTDTQSLSDDQAINLPQDDGTAGHAATFTEFLANGWRWNFSAVLATAPQWWAVAVESEEVFEPAPAPVLADDLMYIEQVTFREPYAVTLVGGDDERLEVFLAQRGLPGT